MKVTEIKWTERIPGEQPYSYSEVTTTSIIEDGDDIEECISLIKNAMLFNDKTDKKSKPKTEKKSTPMIEDSFVDEDEPEKEETKPAPAPKVKKTFKPKATAYDRANEVHKSLFSQSLAQVAPKWKSTDAGKAKAKKLSVDLEGTDYLDDNGDVLESFITAMKKGMK